VKKAAGPGGENPFLMAGVAGLHPIGDLTLENCYTQWTHHTLAHTHTHTLQFLFFSTKKKKEKKDEIRGIHPLDNAHGAWNSK
jgi:hypothetical protein